MGTCTVTTYSGYGNGPASVLNGLRTCALPASNASGSANRFFYEPTFGVIQTFWRNPAYGDLKLITQAFLLPREPWVNTAPASGSILPSAHTSMVYIDLRRICRSAGRKNNCKGRCRETGAAFVGQAYSLSVFVKSFDDGYGLKSDRLCLSYSASGS